MKKYTLILLIVILIFSGCSKKEVIDNEGKFNFETYKVFEPYKESVSGNYINYMVNNNYDVDNIQSKLMDLSIQYFKPSSYYYQAGQYLNSNKIKEILNKINPTEIVNIDGVDIIPKYISYIHEQNFLDKNGTLSGLSIGLALNKYQSYQNSYGTILYKEIDEEEIINYTKGQIPIILNYLREIESLKNARIIIGLYICASPNSILPGSYKYLGITSDNNISFHEVNYSYYYLDSNTLMQKNTDVYNDFKAFKKQINIDDVYISGYGLFLENNLLNASITINSNYLNRDELIYIEQLISKALNHNFELTSSVTVYIKVNNEVIGMVIRDGTKKVLNYILE